MDIAIGLLPRRSVFLLFFFNDTATTEIYTLSLHDALPIFADWLIAPRNPWFARNIVNRVDRKSTRLNSSHGSISYAVFCLKKKINLKTLFFVVKEIILEDGCYCKTGV